MCEIKKYLHRDYTVLRKLRLLNLKWLSLTTYFCRFRQIVILELRYIIFVII